MGIRLMTEVMDYAPAELTHREHKLLIIFAEDALDGAVGELDDRGREKRVVRQSPESPKMLRRARVSRPQLYAVLAELIAKECLERITPGGGGHRARYRIPALAPESCVRENVTQTPTDDEESCVRETETQRGSVSGKTGPSVSRFAKDAGPIQQPQCTPNGARGPVGEEAPEAAEQVRDRNDAAPPQSLRDHDGSFDNRPGAQQNPEPATHQSQAADRNAREDDDGEAERKRQIDGLTELMRQNPEIAATA